MTSLDTAFQNPVLDGQKVFRRLLTAFSRPGKPVALDVGLHAPAPLSPAAGALLLTLADLETPVWLDPAADVEPVRAFLRYGCACPLTQAPAEAAFAVIRRLDRLSVSDFSPGSDEYPDRSATLIVDVDEFYHDRGALLEGPGIEPPRRFGFAPCPESFWAEALVNCRKYPLGVDWIFCCGDQIAALPRSSRPSEF